ncbi:Imm1 family immunity protein [Kitasatospora cineracea]
MILSVLHRGSWRHAQSLQEKLLLVSKIFEVDEADQATDDPRPPREIFELSITDGPQGKGWSPDNCLTVGVNRSSGYGGLAWCVTGNNPKKGGVYDHVWVSDNPEPPDFDPRVVSESYYPHYYDPASAFPIDRIRAAVEEFCRTDSGDRPESITWITGNMNGMRSDREYPDDTVEGSFA